MQIQDFAFFLNQRPPKARAGLESARAEVLTKAVASRTAMKVILNRLHVHALIHMTSSLVFIQLVSL
jgi:hypothetical protein